MRIKSFVFWGETYQEPVHTTYVDPELIMPPGEYRMIDGEIFKLIHGYPPPEYPGYEEGLK